MDHLLDKLQDRLALGIVGYFGSDAALTLDGSEDGHLAGAASPLVAFALGARLAADVGFVGFDDPPQQVAFVGRHRLADALLHKPRRTLIESQVAGELVARQALFGMHHQRNGPKPFLQRQVGAAEDRARQDIETALAGMAVPAPHADFNRPCGRRGRCRTRGTSPALASATAPNDQCKPADSGTVRRCG